MKEDIVNKTTSPSESKGINPFPGLRHFTVEDSSVFFGRKKDSEKVIDKLIKNRFVSIVGVSGSGKSSLMSGGVFPKLAGNTEGWIIITTTPTSNPIHQLATDISIALKKTDQKSIDEIEKKLLNDPNALLSVTKELSSKGNIIIAIDQFEDVFIKELTETTSEIQDKYVELLLNGIKSIENNIHVLITMRSEHIGDSAKYPVLNSLLNESYFLIPKMRREELKDAIEGPALSLGKKVNPDLLKQLLSESEDSDDRLPLLQHALMRTWQYGIIEAGKNEIGIDDYEAIGGIEKALSEHADEVYEELDEEQKLICESLFKTITGKTEEGKGNRNPASIGAIASIKGVSVEEVIKVVDIFSKKDNALLSISSAEKNKNTIVDIPHESLLKHWNRLSDWVEEEEQSVQMYKKLAEASTSYQLGSISLWRPPDLDLALEWKEKQKPTLAWGERFDQAFESIMVFLETSESTYLAEEENKIRVQKRKLKTSRIASAVMGVITVVSVGFLLLSIVQTQKAEEQTAIAKDKTVIAEQQTKIAEKEKENAIEQEKEARKQKDIADVQKEKAIVQEQKAKESEAEALVQKDIAHNKSVEALIEKKNAEKSAEEALKQKSIAEDASDEAYSLRILSIAQSMSVKSLQIEKNKELKALVAFQAYNFNHNFGGKAHNSDIYDGLYQTLKEFKQESFNQLKLHDGVVKSLAHDSKGKYLYSGGADGKVIRWTRDGIQKDGLIIMENGNGIRSLSTSNDDNWLAVGSNEANIRLFDIKDDMIESNLGGHKGVVWSLVFTKNNNELLSASADSTVRVWNVKTKQGRELFKSETRIKCLSISRNGKLLAGGSEDGKIILWEIDKDYNMKILSDGSEDKKNGILTLAFNNDGNLVSGDLKGNLKIWDTKKMNLLFNTKAHNARINTVKVSPDGKMLASASSDGKIMLFMIDKLKDIPIILRDNNSWVWALEFSPDNKTLYAGCVDNQIRVWPTKTEYMANEICPLLSRNMTRDEWNNYVAEDVPMEKTCKNLPGEEDDKTVSRTKTKTKTRKKKTVTKDKPAPIKESKTIEELATNILDSDNPDKVRESIVFKVQFRSSEKLIPLVPENFDGLEDVGYYNEGTTFKYVVGNCKTIEKGFQLQTSMKEKGYKDAFIVAFVHDKRISILEARKLLKDTE